MFQVPEKELDDYFRQCRDRWPNWKWHQYRLSSLFVLMFVCALILGGIECEYLESRLVQRLGGVPHTHGSCVYWADFSSSAIADKQLPLLQRLPELEELSLASTTVSDTGLEHLADLPKLKRLDVAFTQVTPEGLARLKATRPDLHVIRLHDQQRSYFLW
jgi:hypothetical protein